MTSRKVLLGAITVRQILMAHALRQRGSVSAAARSTTASQSNASRTLRALEQAFDTALYRRAGNASILTDAGRLLAPRFAYLDALVRAAASQAAQQHPSRNLERHVLRFMTGLSMRRAGQLLALQDARSIRTGAAALGLSSDAVRKMLRESELRLSAPLFERLEGARLGPSALGSVLLPRLRVLRREVEHAAMDLAAAAGVHRGVLAVGCLPSATVALIPLAVSRTLTRHPAFQVKLAEGTYDELITNLRDGYLDLIVGGLRPAQRFTDLQCEALFEDRLCIFARAGHPLLRRRRLASADLSRFRWVVPSRGPIAEPVLEHLLANAGVTPPAPHIECSSMVAISGLLQADDFLTVGSSSQMQSELGTGRVARVKFELQAQPWSCGLISRAQAPPSVAMRVFREALQEVVKQGATARIAAAAARRRHS